MAGAQDLLGFTSPSPPVLGSGQSWRAGQGGSLGRGTRPGGGSFQGGLEHRDRGLVWELCSSHACSEKCVLHKIHFPELFWRNTFRIGRGRWIWLLAQRMQRVNVNAESLCVQSLRDAKLCWRGLALSRSSFLCTHICIVFVYQWHSCRFLISKNIHQHSWGSEQVYKPITLEYMMIIAFFSHLSFELSLEFYLGPNFSSGFPDYLCGISILVYGSIPTGECELEADLHIYFTFWIRMALVSLCQMSLRVNTAQVAPGFVTVKNQLVLQLMKIKEANWKCLPLLCDK